MLATRPRVLEEEDRSWIQDSKEMEADLGQGCSGAWVRIQVLGALGIGVLGIVSGIQSQVQAQLQKP